MKHSLKYLLFFLAGVLFITQSCKRDDTYADMVKREKKQINAFLKKGIPEKQQEFFKPYLPFPVKVISEQQFEAQGQTTDIEKNEYVLFGTSGVYMQIVNKGDGELLKRGDTRRVLSRYVEFNIARDTIQTMNMWNGLEPDVMIVSNAQGVINGFFSSGMMTAQYRSKAVPAGWLIPLRYVRLGRMKTENSKLAKVRVIVPSTQGQEDAASRTYPCFYEITYEAGR